MSTTCLRSLLALAACASLATPVLAETIVNGGPVGGQTWTPAGSPYRLKGDITIAAGTTLQMLPGTSVVVSSGDLMGTGIDPAAVEITVKGELIVDSATISPERSGFSSIQYAHWHGIVVEPEATRVSITRSTVHALGAGITYRHPGSILDVAGSYFTNYSSSSFSGTFVSGVAIRVEAGSPLIERAGFVSNQGGVSVTGSGRPFIRSNVFGGGCIPGIAIQQTDATAPALRIYNNDFQPGLTAGYSSITINPLAAGFSAEIANNRFETSIYPVFGVQVGGTASAVNVHHNMFQDLAKAVSGVALGAANFQGTGTAGIDLGTNAVDVPTDRDGNGRPRGLAIDIGAYESAGATNKLAVATAGTLGFVVSSPAGIDCGATCEAVFNADTVVTLTPSAGNRSRFAGWSGACAGRGACQVTLNAWKSVVATFAEPGPTRGDVNGDLKADLFWREASPGVGLSWWTMNGAAVTATNYLEVSADWQVAEVGDFNGDGKADIIWRRMSDGATYLWMLNGLPPIDYVDLGIVSPAVWTLVGSADFGGDHKSDLLWRSNTGHFYIWQMYGGVIAVQGGPPDPIGPEWQVVDLVEMNSDGKADIVFRNTTTGEVYIWFMYGSAIAAQASAGTLDPAQWSLVAAADFDGDGKGDFLWREVASGDLWLWIMNGASYVSGGRLASNPGAGWSIKSVADFDGDGKADIVWRHVDGTTYFWKVDGITISVPSYGIVTNPGGSWQVVGP